MAYNLVLGHSGLPSFGHGAFFGLGAYGFGLAQLNLVADLWFCLGAAVVVASLGGAIVAAFISHRRGIYYSLLTIAFGQVFWFIAIKSHAITGGEDGLLKIARLPIRLGVATIDLTGNVSLFYFVLAIFVAVTLLLWRLIHSPFGRVLKAIKQNETRARFVGYEVWRYKAAVLVLSAGLSGLAGGLFAMAQASAFPDVMSLHYSGYVVMMTLVGGGLVTFWGPVLGALVFLLARDVIGAFTTGWMLWFGLLFVALVMYKPEGLGGLFLRAARKPPPATAPASRRNSHGAVRSPRAPPALRRPGRAGGHLAVLRGRPAVGHHGPQRRRQDDLLQRADRPLQARPRPRAVRRRRHHRPLAAGHRAAGHRALLPAHEPVRRIHGLRERGDRAAGDARARPRCAGPRLCRSGAGRRGARDPGYGWVSAPAPTTSPRRCPMANGARWRSPWRSPAGPSSCSSTSRRRAWAATGGRGWPSWCGG